MKKKVLEKYIAICNSYKLQPKKQVVKYLENTELEEKTIFDTEAVNLIFPGNEPNNFYEKIINEDLHPLLSSLLSHGQNIMIIDLSYNLLNQKVGVYLQKLFEFTDNIVAINLRGNQINDVSVDKFIPSLLKKPYLRSLDVNTNLIGNIGIMKINELLYHNTDLEVLNIGHNHYDWDAIIALTSTLKITNKSIKVLNIDDPAYKHIEQDFFTHIGKMFLSNKSLDKLSLRHHKLRFEGCEILFNHLKNNMVLSVIDLSANQICFQGVKHISELLEITHTLKSLNLACNQIHNQGAKILAQGIAANSSLVHLDITQNGIRNDGLMRLAEGLSENSSIKSFKVFKDNFWGVDSILLFQEVLNSKEEFYPDFIIYEDKVGDVQIAYNESSIENEEEYLVPN